MYCLWIVAFVRLLCPFTWESGYSFLPTNMEPVKVGTEDLTKQKQTNPDQYKGSQANEGQQGKLQQGQTLPYDVRQAERSSSNGIEILQVIWLIGILFFLVRGLYTYIRLNKKLIDSQRIGKNRYLSDHLETAFVMGICKPKIYLPSMLEEKEAEYICMHEQVHIKRKDHLIKLLAYAITILHWFNPFVWLAYICLDQEMEMSCDEYVMKHHKEDIRKDYATSLLRLSVGRKRLSGVPLAFGEGNVKKRIKHVLQYKKPLLAVAGGVFLCCVILAVFAFSSPRGETTKKEVVNEKQEMKGKEETKQNPTQNNVVINEVIEKKAPVLKKGMTLGADGPDLDYCEGNQLIFHGYFGLFVYDLEKQQMRSAIDLASIGCDKTQGDSYCEVTVSKDGNEIYLHPMNESYMFVYSIKDDQLIKKEWNNDNLVYTGLQDNYELAGSGNGFYSIQKVHYSNGEYAYDGYLYASDWSVDSLCYVEDDMVFALFPELEEDMK